MIWPFTRLITRARYRMARAAPLTIVGRRPVVLSEADLDARLAERRAHRAARSDGSRKGWETRRKASTPLQSNNQGS